MNIGWPIYRRLAQAFPHEFKLAFGDEMMRAGEDAIAHIAKRHGVLGLVRLIADLLLRLPIEYLSEMRRDLPYAARALMKSPGYAVWASSPWDSALGSRPTSTARAGRCSPTHFQA
jgi:hypothetical protein